jgi:hypothetical protein
MTCVQGGRPLDLRLEFKDDLKYCEGKVGCDHKHFRLLPQYTYGNVYFWAYTFATLST